MAHASIQVSDYGTELTLIQRDTHLPNTSSPPLTALSTPPSEQPSETSDSQHLVVTIHGIRTFGRWQERFERLLKQSVPGVTVYHYKYKYLSILAFLFPPLRWLIIRRFRIKVLQSLSLRQWDRIDFVAHSFGTHLVAHGMRQIPRSLRPRIHTILFAASALPPSFAWNEILADCRARLINDCGVNDWVLAIGQLIPGVGIAGRFGFTGLLGPSLRNRFFSFGHSDYFIRRGKDYDGFLGRYWVPLLTTRQEPEAGAHLPPSSFRHGFSAFVLNNMEPAKIALYLILLGVLSYLARTLVVPQWQLVRNLRLGHGGPPAVLALDLTGRYLVTGASDHTVHVWDLEAEGRDIAHEDEDGLANSAPVYDLAVATDPTDGPPTIFAATSRGEIVRWEYHDSTWDHRTVRVHDSGIARLLFLPDRLLLISAHFDGLLRFTSSDTLLQERVWSQEVGRGGGPPVALTASSKIAGPTVYSLTAGGQFREFNIDARHLSECNIPVDRRIIRASIQTGSEGTRITFIEEPSYPSSDRYTLKAGIVTFPSSADLATGLCNGWRATSGAAVLSSAVPRSLAALDGSVWVGYYRAGSGPAKLEQYATNLEQISAASYPDDISALLPDASHQRLLFASGPRLMTRSLDDPELVATEINEAPSGNTTAMVWLDEASLLTSDGVGTIWEWRPEAPERTRRVVTLPAGVVALGRSGPSSALAMDSLGQVVALSNAGPQWTHATRIAAAGGGGRVTRAAFCDNSTTWIATAEAKVFSSVGAYSLPPVCSSDVTAVSCLTPLSYLVGTADGWLVAFEKGEAKCLLRVNTEPIQSISTNPTGTRVAVVDTRGRLQVYDVDGSILRPQWAKPLENAVRGALFAGSDGILFSGEAGYIAAFREVSTRSLLFRRALDADIEVAILSPKQRRIAVSTGNGLWVFDSELTLPRWSELFGG